MSKTFHVKRGWSEGEERRVFRVEGIEYAKLAENSLGWGRRQSLDWCHHGAECETTW